MSRSGFEAIEDADEATEAEAERRRDLQKVAQAAKRRAKEEKAEAARVAEQERVEAEEVAVIRARRLAKEAEAEAARVAAEEKRVADEADAARLAEEKRVAEEERRVKEEAAEVEHYTRHPLIDREPASISSASASISSAPVPRALFYNFHTAAGLFDSSERGKSFFEKYGQLDQFLDEHEQLLSAGTPGAERVDELHNNVVDTLATMGEVMTQEQRNRLRAVRDAYSGVQPWNAPTPVAEPAAAEEEVTPPEPVTEDHGDVTEVEPDADADAPWTKAMWESWAENIPADELESIPADELHRMAQSLEDQQVQESALQRYRNVMHEELRRRDTEREVDNALSEHKALYEAEVTEDALREIDDEQLGRVIRDFRKALERVPRDMEPTERTEHAAIMLRIAREELNRRYDVREPSVTTETPVPSASAPRMSSRVSKVFASVQYTVQRLQAALESVRARGEALASMRGDRGASTQEAFREYALSANEARRALAKLSRLERKAGSLESLEGLTQADRNVLAGIKRGYEAVSDHLRGKFQVPRFVPDTREYDNGPNGERMPHRDQSRWVMEPLLGQIERQARRPPPPQATPSATRQGPTPARQYRARPAPAPTPTPARESPPSSRSADTDAPPARGFSPPPTTRHAAPGRDTPWYMKSHSQQWMDDAEKVLRSIPAHGYRAGHDEAARSDTLVEAFSTLVAYDRVRKLGERVDASTYAEMMDLSLRLRTEVDRRLGGAAALAGIVAENTGKLYDAFYSDDTYGTVPHDAIRESWEVIGYLRRMYPAQDFPGVAHNILNRAEHHLHLMNESSEANNYMAGVEPGIRADYLVPQESSIDHLFTQSERDALRRFEQNAAAYEAQLSWDNPYRKRIQAAMADVKRALVEDENRKAASHRPQTRSEKKEPVKPVPVRRGRTYRV